MKRAALLQLATPCGSGAILGRTPRVGFGRPRAGVGVRWQFEAMGAPAALEIEGPTP